MKLPPIELIIFPFSSGFSSGKLFHVVVPSLQSFEPIPKTARIWFPPNERVVFANRRRNIAELMSVRGTYILFKSNFISATAVSSWIFEEEVLTIINLLSPYVLLALFPARSIVSSVAIKLVRVTIVLNIVILTTVARGCSKMNRACQSKFRMLDTSPWWDALTAVTIIGEEGSTPGSFANSSFKRIGVSCSLML